MMMEYLNFKKSNATRALALSFLLPVLMLIPQTGNAGQRVNLLISGQASNDYVRGLDSGSQVGYGAGISLSIPSVASGLFNKSGGSGGAKGALNISLDFGLEVGIFYAQEYVSSIMTKVVRVPAILWLQINKNVWFGGGAHLTQHQQPIPAGLSQQYMGALAALRFNFFEQSSTGFGLEARYIHGLQSASVAPIYAEVDGIQGLLSIRFGQI